MATYIARMLDSVTGAEGAYRFEHRDDLMKRPADDVVAAFFEHAEREVFSRRHVEYELNGVVKNQKQKTVVAIGSLRMQGDEDFQPFTIFIAPAS
ncbi:MAG: hypothetical protein ACT4OF_12375 [Caulobacteraceae bacterium]